MTYTFKLARRLAVSRTFSMLPVLLVLAACSGSDATAPQDALADLPESGIYGWRPRESAPVAVLVNPNNVTVETNQLIKFEARGRNRAGDDIAAPVSWSTTGGTILPDGRFSAAMTGTYRVMGRTHTRDGQYVVDTSMVTVVRRQLGLARVIVSPDSVILNPRGSQSFSAVGRLPTGEDRPIGVRWTAKGGTVDAGGSYVAGDTAGTYLLIATNTAGTLADTAIITIAAPPALPPPSDSTPTPPSIPTTPVPPQDSQPAPEPPPAEPPPAPVMAKLIMKPASATLTPNATVLFWAFGRTAAGDSIGVNVTFTATGGTVTSTGLYTAGSTAGTSFRVVATAEGMADTSWVTVSAPLGSGAGTGIPFGPFSLWGTSSTTPRMTAPFTMSFNADGPEGIVTRINSARALGQKLVLSMTDGGHGRYLTDPTRPTFVCPNGGAPGCKFDLVKWKARQDLFNTPSIRAAVMAGLSDGTVLGANVMDEPQHTSWAGSVTKATLDQMASYVKSIFPNLPVGVSARSDWRPTERYKVIDWILTQYGANFGSVSAWRDRALSFAAQDGVRVVFSMNISNGGAGFNETSCPIPQTGGPGLDAGRCRMSPAQVVEWGTTLGPAGIAMAMWDYESSFMADQANLQALQQVAAALAKLPAKSWRRQ
jgi:hypothetical protein